MADFFELPLVGYDVVLDTHWLTSLGLTLWPVEIGRKNPNIVSTSTFECGIKIKIGKVGNENDSEHTGYRKQTNSSGNMSKMIGIRKTKTGIPTRRTKSTTHIHIIMHNAHTNTLIL